MRRTAKACSKMDHGRQISRRTTSPLLLVCGLALVGLSAGSCGSKEKHSDMDGGFSVFGGTDGAVLALPHMDATADVMSTDNNPSSTGVVAISVSGLGAVGFNYTQGSYITGFVFRANTAISITQFGYYDSNLTGGVETFQPHAVGLYDLSTHTLLGSATVQPSDPVTGLFHYASLTSPIAINTADTYAIVGVTGTNNYTVGITASEAPVNAALTYLSGAGYGPSNNNATMTSTLVEPNAFDAGNIFGQPTPTGTLCDFGPNFMFVTSSGGSDGGVDSAITSSDGSTSSSDGSTASSDGLTGVGRSDVSVDAAVTSSDGSVADVSCDFTTQGMHLCTGFSGLSVAAAAQEQVACTQQNQGTFAQAACLTANVSATCTFTSTGAGQFAGIPAGIVVTYVWYSLSAAQIASAQQVCSTTLGGSWSGG